MSDRNSFQPDAVLPDYEQGRTSAQALLRDQATIGDPPEVVAKAVAAATAKRLRRRHPAGKVARQVSLLRRFAPADAFDKTLRKEMRLPA